MRLKKVLHKVIDGRQSVFLEDRGLMDGVLAANEVLEEERGRKVVVFSSRLIMKKVYDSVIWDFVYYMMERLGFCGKWVGCIR